MRRVLTIPLLLFALLLAACDDVAGIGGRSLDGEWRARLDGEELWMTLREERGEVWGAGEWGFDEVYISGEQVGSEVYLVIEFDYYEPVRLEGDLRGREIDGWLYGSGLDGARVRFYRD